MRIGSLAYDDNGGWWVYAKQGETYGWLRILRFRSFDIWAKQVRYASPS